MPNRDISTAANDPGPIVQLVPNRTATASYGDITVQPPYQPGDGDNENVVNALFGTNGPPDLE